MNPQSEDSIELEIHLDEPREKVWRALSTPEIAAEWLAREIEVIDADKPDRIQYRLRDGDEHERFAVESTVTIELRDAPDGGEGTRLKITHDQFELHEEPTVALLKAA